MQWHAPKAHSSRTFVLVMLWAGSDARDQNIWYMLGAAGGGLLK